MTPVGKQRISRVLLGAVMIFALTWMMPQDVQAVKVVREKAKKVEPVKKENDKAEPSQKKLLKDVESQRKNAEKSGRRYDPWVDQNNDGVNDKLKDKQPPPIPPAKSAEPEPTQSKAAQVETTKAKKSDTAKSTPRKKVRRR